MVSTAAIIALLQAALSLILLVQGNPHLDLTVRENALMVANQAIQVATQQINLSTASYSNSSNTTNITTSTGSNVSTTNTSLVLDFYLSANKTICVKVGGSGQTAVRAISHASVGEVPPIILGFTIDSSCVYIQDVSGTGSTGTMAK